jgi:hypothetical protein
MAPWRSDSTSCKSPLWKCTNKIWIMNDKKNCSSSYLILIKVKQKKHNWYVQNRNTFHQKTCSTTDVSRFNINYILNLPRVRKQEGSKGTACQQYVTQRGQIKHLCWTCSGDIKFWWKGTELNHQNQFVLAVVVFSWQNRAIYRTLSVREHKEIRWRNFWFPPHYYAYLCKKVSCSQIPMKRSTNLTQWKST